MLFSHRPQKTPYSWVNWNIAFTFSGFASSSHVDESMMNPPSLPAVSMSFLQYCLT